MYQGGVGEVRRDSDYQKGNDIVENRPSVDGDLKREGDGSGVQHSVVSSINLRSITSRLKSVLKTPSMHPIIIVTRLIPHHCMPEC